MKVHHYREVAPLSVAGIEETTKSFTIRRVFNEVEGAGDLMLDVFEIGPSGYSEMHQHSWDHQVFVVSGTGEVGGGAESLAFKAGDVIFIPPDEAHQFRATGTEPVVFVCSIPKAAIAAYYIDQAGGAGE